MRHALQVLCVCFGKEKKGIEWKEVVGERVGTRK